MKPFKLLIKVLAYNRPHILRQCLLNLNEAYLTYPVDLDIFIDGPKQESDRELVLKTTEIARSFDWKHGRKSIIARSENVGILGQWLGCWREPIEGEYALVVEEDVELTPLFPLIIQHLLQHLKPGFYYGISLQRPQWQLGQNEKGGWRRLDLIRSDHPMIFSYPAIGTWGQLLVAEAWREFLQASLVYQPIDGLIMSKWQEERANLFTPVFMHWQAGSGYTNLYTHLGVNGTAFAINSQPEGVNFKEIIYHDRLADERQVFDWLAEIGNLTGVPRFNECFDLMGSSGAYNASDMSEAELYEFLCDRKANRMDPIIISNYPSLVHRLGFIPSSEPVSHYSASQLVCGKLKCPYKESRYPDPKYTI